MSRLQESIYNLPPQVNGEYSQDLPYLRNQQSDNLNWECKQPETTQRRQSRNHSTSTSIKEFTPIMGRGHMFGAHCGVMADIVDVNNLATTAAMNENGSPNDETTPPTEPSQQADDQTLALQLQRQEANDQGIAQLIAKN
ncbi:hypothetical protein TIFTF001_029853 [Ficus carica]|uniref:Uncharacterized protein n=1 Tax=Ficus carica TaxID=3494 RepID=A0AA88DT31_FICCA|nr:hypothetical protein TIFTF001_029853 [Ficus carica]